MKLELCPMCGSGNISKVRRLYPKVRKKWFIECEDCHCCSKNYMTKVGAVWHWNRIYKEI